ncbi:MAG TPA: hypothetical protein VGO59_17700 [Verrucomicrobiae bacterium]|jgi:hypothetical protein
MIKYDTIKRAFLLAAAASLAAAVSQAQPAVSWQAPVTISGASDVVTNGYYFGTWAPQDGSANGDPVNGVTFQGFSDLPGLNSSSLLDDGYNGFGNPNTSDTNYNTLLQYGRFSDEGNVTVTFGWNEMTAGRTYLVEFWVNDGRNIGQARSETISGGGIASQSLSYGSDGFGPGQFIIGTFVADNSQSQTLTLTPFSNGSSPDPQINLLQIRDVTTNTQPNVTWSAPVTISGASDVSTLGTYFGSWAPQDGAATNDPVNGVTFEGFSDLPAFAAGATLDNGYNGFNSPNTADSDYNFLLQSGRFSNEGRAPATFFWAGMTPGDTYQVQFWVNDARNIGEARSETITGGSNVSARVSYGSDGFGPGQYITGTFVADDTGAQTLILNGYSTGADPDPQVNLFQVRDITATLAPPSPKITSVAVNGALLTITATGGPANGGFNVLQSADLTVPPAQWTSVFSGSFDSSGDAAFSANVVNPSNPREFYILQNQ